MRKTLIIHTMVFVRHVYSRSVENHTQSNFRLDFMPRSDRWIKQRNYTKILELRQTNAQKFQI